MYERLILLFLFLLIPDSLCEQNMYWKFLFDLGEHFKSALKK